MNDADWVYSPRETVFDKVRRKAARFVARRPAPLHFDQPVVSFAFDDAPVTALNEGARILEDEGMRGTFYVCAGIGGRDSPMGVYGVMDDIRRVAAAGHEIGCHTYSHLDCGRSDAATMQADVDLNVKALADQGIAVETFAYPYGEVSGAAKRVLGPKYRALRTVRAGMIRDEADLNWLPAVGIEGPDGEAKSVAWMDRARDAKAWVILFSHDVRPEPSPWGCTPDALRRLAQKAKADGFRVMTVRDALTLGQQTPAAARAA